MERKMIEEELINNGYELADFNITLRENGYAVSAKPSYEVKKIAKQCDKPVIEDINVVAETTVIAMIDINIVAETVALLMNEIENLKSELEVLKNG